jgi:hypothetical protein
LKKFVSLLLILVLFLSVSSQAFAAIATPEIGTSNKVIGGYIQSKFDAGGIYGQVIDYDFYLTVPDAQKLADKIRVSDGEVITWFLASLITSVANLGTINATLGTAFGVYRSQVASAVDNLAYQNKKVHVMIQTSGGGIAKTYTVSEWDGQVSSITPSHAHSYGYFEVVTKSYKYSGWLKEDGVWYYLDNNGYKKTGWLYTGGEWYYLNSSGAMQIGWLYTGGKWYYLQSSGAMQTGWLQYGGTWVYFDSSGAMQTGWLQYGGTWVYFNSSGAMQTGWQYIGDSWYYFYSTGGMAYSTTIEGYKLGSDGKML